MPLTVAIELNGPLGEVARKTEYPLVAVDVEAVHDSDELIAVGELQGFDALSAVGAVRLAVVTLMGPPVAGVLKAA
ncbi:MAG TPA: hypothetical protein VFP54_05845 [Acidimicrobiales bacterium]|nr:hypothetical protein [Acidimicrobiales bacterium]